MNGFCSFAFVHGLVEYVVHYSFKRVNKILFLFYIPFKYGTKHYPIYLIGYSWFYC